MAKVVNHFEAVGVDDNHFLTRKCIGLSLLLSCCFCMLLVLQCCFEVSKLILCGSLALLFRGLLLSTHLTLP